MSTKIISQKRIIRELSLSNKVKVINEIDRGLKKKKDIAVNFGISASTLSAIIKSRERLLNNNKNCVNKSKRIKTCKYEDIEEATLEWFTIVKIQ